MLAELPLVLASLGELIPSALLNLGTVGVSNAAFLFIAPFVERCGTGVLGTIFSSLYPLTTGMLSASIKPTCQTHHHPS